MTSVVERSLGRALVALLITIPLVPLQAVAGQPGHATLVGHVTDESGAPLPGVTVTAAGVALPGREVTAVSGPSGEYRVALLAGGVYAIQYELSGFETVRRNDVRLTAGATATLDLTLKSEVAKPSERLGFRETVFVTAQMRAENVRDIPISLTAFTSSQIEEAGIEKPGDALGLIPNVFVAETFTVGSSLIMSRGVAQTHNGSSPLAVVVDGVYQGNQKQFNQELFDVERIEVLKGPEGALYGRNSIGGAVNIITKQPTEKFEGYARASVGNGSSLGGAFAVSGPLSGDKLLFRVSGSSKNSDGLIENTFLKTEADSYEDNTGRLQIRWNPTQRFSIDGKASVSHTNGGAVLYSIFPTTGFANDFSFPPEANILGSSKRRMHDYTVRAEWAGRAFKATYISGYSTLTETYRADADLSHSGGRIATPFGQLGQGQDLDVQMFSQELRVASPDRQRLRWTVGAYRLDTDRELTSQLFADTNSTVAGFFPIVRVAEEDDNGAWAVFGQADLKHGEHWTFSGSARYDTDGRRQVDLVSGGARKTSFDALQPRFTATYQPTSAFLTYLNVGRGFRSGGYNAPTVTPDIFQKELSTNVEFGARSTLAKNHLHIDGAVYFTRLDNAQYFRLDFASASQIIDNMNHVSIRGAEVTVTSRPVRGLELYAALGVNDSQIDDFNGSEAFDGNQTPTNIRSMMNAGAQYARLIGKGIVGILRADVQRRGRQYWTPDNLDVQDPISLLNLRFSMLVDKWSVVAWSKNVTNEKYYVEYGDAAWSGIISGDDIAWLGRPRSVGIDLVRKF